MFPLERSDYYQFWLRERAEIERNKWYLSEQNHGEVTWAYAQWDWIWRHRAKWIEGLRASGELVA